MDTTVDTALATPRGVAVPTGRNEGRFATALIAAVPFVIAWIGLVTTQLGQRAWYSDEDGLAENLQVVFLLLATLGAGVVARAHWERGRRALAVAYLGFAVACFF